MKQDQVDALIVSSAGEHITNRVVLVELTAKNRLPAIYPFKEFTDVGGLMAYSVDLGEIYRIVADIVDPQRRQSRRYPLFSNQPNSS